MDQASRTDLFTMYGAEVSLYSGKLRSYLRKKGIPFTEVSPSVLTYKRFIEPRTGVRFIPVLHTPQDQVLQDTTAIIDQLEPRFPARGVYPQTPRQRLAALLLELYGDEWLLIAALHYRWSFPEHNLPFLYDEFGRLLFPWFPRVVQRALGRRVARPFKGFVAKLGVTPETRAAVEQSYADGMAELDRHLAEHSFLFGSRPSIGDFGLIGPLYAHLYRDPYPGRKMRESLPRVAAWVERMMAARPAEGEFLGNDEIPDTLWPLLERMAREQVPVLLDTEKRLLEWHRANPDRAHVPRVIGEHQFMLEGTTGTRAVLPHVLWRWQRPRDLLQTLTGAERGAALALADRLGLKTALSCKPRIRLARRDNRFVIDSAAET